MTARDPRTDPRPGDVWLAALYLVVTLPFSALGGIAALVWTAIEIGWSFWRHHLIAALDRSTQRGDDE